MTKGLYKVGCLPNDIDQFSVFEVFYVLYRLIGEERLRGGGTGRTEER